MAVFFYKNILPQHSQKTVDLEIKPQNWDTTVQLIASEFTVFVCT